MRTLLKAGTDLDQAQELFFSLHGSLHNDDVSEGRVWSYADLIFSDLDEEDYRIIPQGMEHSLIWILWHISRIEDQTMNVVVAGGEQVYLREGWQAKLAAPIDHSGNLISGDDHAELTAAISPQALHSYRVAVGRSTWKVVKNLDRPQLSSKVQPERLERLISEGAVLEDARSLLEYWGRKTIYQMLLMPPTRHLMVHLNEAQKVKGKLKAG